MSQTKVGNQNTNNSARLVKLPLRVNPETIEANGQVGKVHSVRIGSKHYPCTEPWQLTSKL